MRLQPLVLRTPKVLLPVAGKPTIQYLFEMLKSVGVHEIIVSLNHNQCEVEEYFGNGEKLGVSIKYFYEKSAGEKDKPGAIGAIKEVVEKNSIAEDCLIVGGDNFAYGLDLKKMVEFHKKSKSIATIGLYYLQDRSLVELYGIAVTNAESRITKFQEKPRVEYAASQLASTAIYYLSAEFLKKYLGEYIAEKKAKGERPDRPGDLWQHFAEKIPIYGFVFQGIWGDSNSAQSYVELNKQAMNLIVGTARKHEKAIVGGEIVLGENVEVSEGAVLKGPVIIEDDCVIGNSVIGPYTHLMHGTKVGDGSVVSGSILFEDVQVGSHCVLQDCIVDGHAFVGNNSRIEDYSVIGFKARVGNNARIFSRSRIWPFVEVNDEAVVEGLISISTEHVKKELQESCFWK